MNVWVWIQKVAFASSLAAIALATFSGCAAARPLPKIPASGALTKPVAVDQFRLLKVEYSNIFSIAKIGDRTVSGFEIHRYYNDNGVHEALNEKKFASNLRIMLLGSIPLELLLASFSDIGKQRDAFLVAMPVTFLASFIFPSWIHHSEATSFNLWLSNRLGLEGKIDF